MLTLALLSLTGIPPLIGFVAKLALFWAAIEAGFAWLAVLAVLNTVVSLFYYLRVIGAMYLGSPGGEVVLLDRAAPLVCGVAALLILGLGLAAQLILAVDLGVVAAGR